MSDIDPSEKEFREIYREVLKKELSQVDFAKQKKEFLKKHFEPQAPFVFRPVVFVPALALVMLFVFARFPISFNPAVSDERAVSVETNPVATRPIFPEPPKEPADATPRVEVKRLTSRSGPVMVYQKTYQEMPVTIIWTFSGGTP